MKDQAITPKTKQSKKTKVKKIKADTIVSIVLDMSGSMSGIAAATREGLNAYLNSLREDSKNNDEVLVSITVFDSGWERGSYTQVPRINTIFNLTPLSEVPEITVEHYQPNGGTPLYDAIGAVVERTDEALKRVKGKPDVLLVIITDGEENSSRKLSSNDAKVLIEEKQGKGWTPVYLGANQDSWAVSQTLGISAGSAVNFAASNQGVQDQVFKKLGARTTAHRMAKSAVYGSSGAESRGLVGSYTTNNFFAGDDEDLEGMVAEMTKGAKLGDVDVTAQPDAQPDDQPDQKDES